MESGTHFTAHAGGIQRVGWDAGVGLHRVTVPRVPMAATVDVSTWPVAGDPAVLAAFVARPSLGEQADLDPRLGYPARRADLGGLALGDGLRWQW